MLAPLVVALALAPSIAGLLLATGAFAAFLAHEPLLVLRGRRGARALAQNTERAQMRLALCILVASIGGLAGMVLAPEVLVLATAVGLAAGVVVGLSWLDEAHTLVGEIGGAAALAGAAAPVAVAGGMPVGGALALWAMWALAFSSTVAAVHIVIANFKRRATLQRWLQWIAILAASGVGLVIGWRSSAVFAAGLPLWLVAAVVTVARPPTTRLRRVGVLLAVTTGVTTIWLITGGLT
jgi:hypothetical protein